MARLVLDQIELQRLCDAQRRPGFYCHGEKRARAWDWAREETWKVVGLTTKLMEGSGKPESVGAARIEDEQWRQCQGRNDRMRALRSSLIHFSGRRRSSGHRRVSWTSSGGLRRLRWRGSAATAASVVCDREESEGREKRMGLRGGPEGSWRRPYPLPHLLRRRGE